MVQKIQSFTGLEAWKEAHRLVIAIYEHTKTFPSAEQFGLTNQLRRAAVSISSNIAEGFSRKSKKEKVQFYATALASLREVQNQVLIARDIKYIERSGFDQLAQKTVLISKLINGLTKTAKSKS